MGICGLQDARHLLVQVLQRLQQARQQKLVVVLVMQLGGPYTQHITVMMSKQLPEAADVLVFSLVSVSVCREGREREPVGDGTEACPWCR